MIWHEENWHIMKYKYFHAKEDPQPLIWTRTKLALAITPLGFTL